MPTQDIDRNRKFGLEVEFQGSTERVLAELVSRGLAQSRSMSNYSQNSDTYWIVKGDASVERGGELVSPPLLMDDPDQRGQVAKAVEALTAAGVQPHQTAGIHVHINASDLDGKQVVGVARTFTKFEDQIYRIASSGWLTVRNYRWCKPIERATVEKIAKARTKEQLATAWYGAREAHHMSGHGHHSRYHGLNLHSYFYRGTIEFRIFNSSINIKRIEAYIILAMAIVQDGRDGKLRSINKVFKLGDMKAGILPDKKAFHHLCQMLRWENDISPISKEDLALISYCWKNSVPQEYVA